MWFQPITTPFSVSDHQVKAREKLFRLQVALRMLGVETEGGDVALTGFKLPEGIVLKSSELMPNLHQANNYKSRPLSQTAFIEANRLATKLGLLERSQSHARTKNTWGALHRGLRDDNAWEAFHQYVRVLEAISVSTMKDHGAGPFATRLQHIIPNSIHNLTIAYRARSYVEHSKDYIELPDTLKLKVSPIKALNECKRLMPWIEVAACQAMVRLLSVQDWRSRFAITSGYESILSPNYQPGVWLNPIVVEDVWESWRNEITTL